MRRTVTGSIHGTDCPCGVRVPPLTTHECDIARIGELEAENERLKAELACPPGGWIDQLRTRAEQAEAELVALKEASKARNDELYDRWVAEVVKREQAEAERDGITRQYEAEMQKRLAAEAENERILNLNVAMLDTVAEQEAERDDLQQRLLDELAKNALTPTGRDRLEQAEAELAAALGSRSCETCLYWTRHTYDNEGLCESTITYKPDWAEDDDPPRTVEALALWGSNGEYCFNPPADFGCNRWAAREEEK